MEVILVEEIKDLLLCTALDDKTIFIVQLFGESYNLERDN
jgi:hypothetical protein